MCVHANVVLSSVLALKMSSLSGLNQGKNSGRLRFPVGATQAHTLPVLMPIFRSFQQIIACFYTPSRVVSGRKATYAHASGISNLRQMLLLSEH